MYFNAQGLPLPLSLVSKMPIATLVALPTGQGKTLYGLTPPHLFKAACKRLRIVTMYHRDGQPMAAAMLV